MNEAPDYPEVINDIYQSRRDALCDGLDRIGWHVAPPKGTMFVWAPIPEPYREMGSLEFAKYLVKEADVATSPGVGFGPGGDGHVRFALIENEQRIGQAVRSLRKALTRLTCLGPAVPRPAQRGRAVTTSAAPKLARIRARDEVNSAAWAVRGSGVRRPSGGRPGPGSRHPAVRPRPRPTSPTPFGAGRRRGTSSWAAPGRAAGRDRPRPWSGSARAHRRRRGAPWCRSPGRCRPASGSSMSMVVTHLGKPQMSRPASQVNDWSTGRRWM